jgi:hypothetical protein
VGLEGSYDALEPIIRSYGADATRIYFPYPTPLSPASMPHLPAMRENPAMMVMTFDRAGLARAAASAMRGEGTKVHPAAPSCACEQNQSCP